MPTLLATHSRGNHGGIAPTKIGPLGDPQPGQPRGDCPYQNRSSWRPTAGATTGGLPLPKSVNPPQGNGPSQIA
ncbi:hypothetical protein PROH_12665 [Prochlorothrix hollandica PCC 9006 = CALU 1027]|uniref:Uncharacterized protein n=1 Tax=Prochlorothrix hollandica PCC 9006 = CALU 1027 TaxID=317619 RepID=A0A0M2PYJ6_PROHO|nr:hypothetical protein PROH_12665 [Prochlorothrix hollandica PCC 9006 = CALU 1027]